MISKKLKFAPKFPLILLQEDFRLAREEFLKQMVEFFDKGVMEDDSFIRSYYPHYEQYAEFIKSFNGVTERKWYYSMTNDIVYFRDENDLFYAKMIFDER